MYISSESPCLLYQIILLYSINNWGFSMRVMSLNQCVLLAAASLSLIITGHITKHQEKIVTIKDSSEDCFSDLFLFSSSNSCFLHISESTLFPQKQQNLDSYGILLPHLTQNIIIPLIVI